MTRLGEVRRTTGETDISVRIDLDGTGGADIATGIGFLDHMLTLFARHGLMDLVLSAEGDLATGSHHTIEDVGIALGQAIDRAAGVRESIERYGASVVPMDEVLVEVALDLSGRPLLVSNVAVAPTTIGGFEAECVTEFLRGLANHGRMTLHVRVLADGNVHHVLEAVFKATARALAAALRVNPRSPGVPSTKGAL
ncbi:MAG: imidazoleglycerol-phosphate dehydratase HisB [Actinobacteria bacterium]|nr:imidazoleglycerol-phosphate dehydratase HisB [Actinomycetota bacterium]